MCVFCEDNGDGAVPVAFSGHRASCYPGCELCGSGAVLHQSSVLAEGSGGAWQGLQGQLEAVSDVCLRRPSESRSWWSRSFLGRIPGFSELLAGFCCIFCADEKSALPAEWHYMPT